MTKIYRYQIRATAKERYRDFQEAVLKVYRKKIDVEILFLQDKVNPLFKTEILRFNDASIDAIERLDTDPEIGELFHQFMTEIIDPELGKIEEQILTEDSLSDAGKLHHVEIYCSNLDRSKEFWLWLLKELGYHKYQEWPKGLSLRLGSTYLVFVQSVDKYKSVPFHRAQPGLNHLAFHASSKAQVDELTLKLKARGSKILYADRHPYASGPDVYAVFFEDPEGLKVEVVY